VAILVSIFGFIGQQAGRFLTAALGWASTLLFGRVPKSQQLLLAVITLGSLAWAASLVGVLMPTVGVFLLAVVPAPTFVDEAWLRLAMLVVAIVTPLLIGIGSLFIGDTSQRPRGAQLIRQVLSGYPLAFLLAFILVFLAVVGVARKVRSLAKGLTDAHIPIVVKPGGYATMVNDLEDALDQAGLEVDRRPAPPILSLPAHLVAAVAGGGVRYLVPDQLTMLTGRHLEVGLYPSDISISGKPNELARARAAIASRLTSTAAHLTTSKESQAVEDRIERLAKAPPTLDSAGAVALSASVDDELRAIDATLATLNVDYGEWEVLYRMRLQVERDLLAGSRVGEAFPGGRPRPAVVADTGPSRWASALGAAGIVLVGLDVGLAAMERIRPPRAARLWSDANPRATARTPRHPRS
jgi:hypothetical protein